MTPLCTVLGIASLLAACAGSREVSKLRYTSTDCPDPKGCAAPLGEQEYQLPDEAHDPVADAAASGDGPSCTSVAHALAAIELGNYASEDTDEERAAIIAQQEKACVAAKLDAREMACMSSVTEPRHVGYCTRKLGAPTQRVALLAPDACKTLIRSMADELEEYGMKRYLVSYEAACIEDGWSDELAACLRERGGAYPSSRCGEHAPGWVFQQLQARIDATR